MLHLFYPNIKITRLKCHYLPLVLRPVLPHWWDDARCWENPRAAPSNVQTQGPVDLKWACYIWRIFCPTSFRELIHFVSRIFCVIENHYVRMARKLFSLVLNSQIWAKNWWVHFCYFIQYSLHFYAFNFIVPADRVSGGQPCTGFFARRPCIRGAESGCVSGLFLLVRS